MKKGFISSVAILSAKRPWVTVLVWLLVLTGAFFIAGGIGDAVTQEERVTVPTDSQEAKDLVEEYQPDSGSDANETLVVESSSAKFGDQKFDELLANLKTELKGIKGVSNVVVASKLTPQLVSDDKTVALARLTNTDDEDHETLNEIKNVIKDLEGDGFSVSLFGTGSINAAMDELAEESLIKGELVGIGVALVILAFVFGALVASGVPIVIAISSILVAIALATIIGRFFDLSFFVVNMITMVGLALGIDYTLIAVQRFREELRNTKTSVDEAIAIMGSTATRAVAFSGITVVVALTGMLFVPSTVMISLGAGAILVASASIVAAMTLLPAILKLIGRKINKGHIPLSRSGQEPRFWKKLAGAVLKRPIVSAVLGLILMLTIASPALSLRMSFPGLDALPEDNNLRQTSEILTKEFDYGQSGTYVAVEGVSGYKTRVTSLASAMEDSEAFKQVNVEFVDGKNAALVFARDKFSPTDIRSEDALKNLRTELVPNELGDLKAYVGGSQASTVDFTDVVVDSVPVVISIVLVASFIILTSVFRSIVVPVKAIILNLLSTSAAYGALVAVFQWGWGAELLGFTQVDAIAPWLPLFLFSVLFGLSMDYNVFLLSRIKEEYDVTKNTKTSVIHGLTKTGSLITGAALIMVAVFAGFSLGDVPELAQMGFGLAVAVILDVTIVRSLLLPSLMTMLGDVNWYLPKWLRWLPEAKVE